MASPPTTPITSNRIIIQQEDRQVYIPSSTTYADAILQAQRFLDIPTSYTVELLLGAPQDEARTVLDEARWQAVVTSDHDLAVIHAQVTSPTSATCTNIHISETQEQILSSSENPADFDMPLTTSELGSSSYEVLADLGLPEVQYDSSSSSQSISQLAPSESPTSITSTSSPLQVIATSCPTRSRCPISSPPILPFEASSSRHRQNHIDSPSHALPLQATRLLSSASSDRLDAPNWREGLESPIPSSSQMQSCNELHIPSPTASPPPLTNSGCSSGVSTPSSMGSPHQHFAHLHPNNVLAPSTADAAIHDQSSEPFRLSLNDTPCSDCLRGNSFGPISFRVAEETHAEGPFDRARNSDHPNSDDGTALMTTAEFNEGGSVRGRQQSTTYWDFPEATEAISQARSMYPPHSIDILEDNDTGGSSATWPLMVDLRPSSVERNHTPSFEHALPDRHHSTSPSNSNELLVTPILEAPGGLPNPSEISIAPPPYTSRHDPQHNRRVTFCVSLPTGESIYVAARKQTRLLKALESACSVFHLQPYKCRIIYEGRTFGHGDIARLTIGSLDIRDGDQVDLTWDDIIAHSDIYMQSTTPSSATGSTSSPELPSLQDMIHARAIVTLTPRWIFEGLSPLVPIDLMPAPRGLEPRSKAVWNVRTRTDGMLTISGEARVVNSFGWEAQIKPVQLAPPIEAPVTSNSATPEIVRSTSTSLIDPEPGGVLQHHQRPPEHGAKRGIFPVSYREVLVHLATLLLGIISFLLKAPLLEGPLSYAINDPRIRRVTGMIDSEPDSTSNGSYPISDDGLFHPMEASDVLRDNTCVVLESSNVSVYLLDTLKELGVPDSISRGWTSQRLSLMVRHKWLAIRFLSKLSLTECSTLRIAPEPDEVVRVFMVYMGIPSNELSLWNEAKARGSQDIENRRIAGIGCGQAWREIVLGSDVDAHGSRFGFRVFDLGWLEILP